MATLSSGDTISLQDIYSGSRLTGDLSSYDGMFSGFNPSQGLSMGFLQEYRNATAGTQDTTIISMSAAAIDSVDGINGYTYIVEGTNENYSIDVSGAGWYAQDMFIDAGTTGNSAIWMDDPNSKFGSHYTSEAAARGNINGASDSISAGNFDNSDGVLDNVVSGTVKAKYADYVNDHATNYDTLLTKTIYAVDSYDGNTVSLCLSTDTPVVLSDGSTIEIGDVEEGMILKGYSLNGLSDYGDSDYIDWSTDSLNETESDVEVSNVVFSFASKYYNINNGELKATAEHPFLVLSNGTYKFKRTHLLEVNDSLIKVTDGGVIASPISSIEAVDEDIEIVSIDVNNTDTYIANGYITHNKGTNSHTDFDGPTAPTTIDYTRPNLSWSGGTADGDSVAGITAYDIQIATNNGGSYGTTILSLENWNSTSIQLYDGDYDSTGPAGSGPLAKNTQYWARVRNVQSGLKSPWIYYPLAGSNFFVI